MYDGPIAAGPGVKAVPDVRVLFPEAGVIRVESERIFSQPDGALCRRFLQAALRLRAENPGVYESYVDLEPGAWTKIKMAHTSTLTGTAHNRLPRLSLFSSRPPRLGRPCGRRFAMASPA